MTVSQVQFLRLWTSLYLQRCWVLRTVKEPQIQFIAPPEDIPVVQVVDIPVVAQMQIPLVRLPAVPECRRGGDSRAPTVAAR